MHECTSIIINSFNLIQRNLFNKWFIVEEGDGEGGGRGRLKSEWKQSRGGEGSSVSLYLLCEKKNHPILQTVNRVPLNILLGSC